MTATIISNNMPYSFGQQTNQAVSRLVALNTQLARLHEAIATASAGYDGIPGTQFEQPMPTTGGAAPMPMATGQPSNLFGVQPSDVAGEQGQTYRYAMDQLNDAWTAFWEQARPYVEQLDNGGNTL